MLSLNNYLKYKMKKIYLLIFLAFGINFLAIAQDVMTPEKLWQVKRLSALGLSEDNSTIFFKLSIPNIEENKMDSKYYKLAVQGGSIEEIGEDEVNTVNKNLSPDGTKLLYHKAALLENTLSTNAYPTLSKSDAYIFTELDYRHWDSWNDGKYHHVFYKTVGSDDEDGIDIMPGEPYYTPQRPFGGDEDYIWSSDGQSIYYVSKKLKGTAYAISTNTDIYRYDLNTKTTTNLTEDNKGYDTDPEVSNKGALAWLQMEMDGYEADKNDIVVLENGVKQNLTTNWDGTVSSFKWNKNGESLYFIAAVDGTKQLFEVNYPGKKRIAAVVNQLSEGWFDVNSIVAELGSKLIVTRSDMNHANDLYSFDIKSKTFTQLTNVNKELYDSIEMPKIEKRMVATTDGKQMLVWVILPPNFDASKKYPTLLYCQGGPQSALSQFYSYRWNFQLMASQGYIVVAPNRRGMPGHGVEWNEQISKDWGGQNIRDYLSAIDAVAKEPYVDNTRLGAVGASYGGYSVFYLAGIHKNRFKTFIAHDGIFNLKSMYGTTEELFFVNHDFGGKYWDKSNSAAQKSYSEFNPINLVEEWDTPIMIIQGGKDYRVSIEQGLEAFQAAQLKGIKSKLLYLPSENHWVTSPQNSLVWQHEFFKWLKETL